MRENKVTREQLVGCTAISGIGSVLALLMLLAVAAVLPRSALLQNHLSAVGEGVIMLCALAAGWVEKRRYRTVRLVTAAVTSMIMTAVLLLAGTAGGCKYSGAAVIVNLIAVFFVSFAGTFLAGKGKKKPHHARYYRK